MSQMSHVGSGQNFSSASAEGALWTEDGGAAELFRNETNSPEAIRHDYLAHEATVGAIGLVLYIRSIYCLLQAALLWFQPARVAALVAAAGAERRLAPIANRTLIIGSLVGAAFAALLGAQLRDFKGWARWTLVVVIALATLVHGRIVGLVFERGLSGSVCVGAISMVADLWIAYALLIGEDGKIFSPEYETVISLTPEMKARMRFGDHLLVGVTVVISVIGLLLW